MSQAMTKLEELQPTIENLSPWSFDSNPTDEDFEKVFEWYSDLPKIFKSFTIFQREEKDEFIQDLKEGKSYTGRVDGELKCFIHGEIKSNIVVEGHLFCEPHTNLDLICNMVTYAKNQALIEFEYVTTQILKKHPILHTVMLRAGFLDTGLRSYSQVYKGSLLEIVHYVVRRP